jgi:hypothetical protein
MFYPALAVSPYRRAVVLHAARSWRLAADSGAATQPALHRALVRYGCDVLAPAFDSLMRLHERCLGRIFGTAQPDAMNISADEARLLECLAGSAKADSIVLKITAGSALASTFKVALVSTRFMIGMALKRDDSVELVQQRWLARSTC